MDEEHPKSLPKIRTFARDQAHVQHHDEPAVVVPAVVPTVTEKPITVEKKQPVVVPAAHITGLDTQVPVHTSAGETGTTHHADKTHSANREESYSKG